MCPGSQLGSGSEAVLQCLLKGKSTQVFKRQTKPQLLQSKMYMNLKTQEILQVDILSGHCSSHAVLKVIPLNIRSMKTIAFKVRKICTFPDCIKP